MTRLSLPRFALTGALTALILFVLCWLASQVGNLPLTHMWIGLFTPDPLSSSSALITGGLSSFGAGAVLGAVIAIIYNALGSLERRAD